MRRIWIPGAVALIAAAGFARARAAMRATPARKRVEDPVMINIADVKR
ncbi:MAG TPA: hypothetical protein VMH79_08060 [Thermoanaerobaculia bacterium]|nr:hypothetical protein [Thermoanaerobaculia bacterium]